MRAADATESDMRKTMTLVGLVLAALLAGCAGTGGEYAKVDDRKYNEVRLVNKAEPGALIGTSATTPAARPAGQRP